jgi:hypothetical protein
MRIKEWLNYLFELPRHNRRREGKMTTGLDFNCEAKTHEMAVIDSYCVYKNHVEEEGKMVGLYNVKRYQKKKHN